MCKDSITSSEDSEGEKSSLLRLKEYKVGTLCHPSPEAFYLISQVERLIRRFFSSLMESLNRKNRLKEEATVLASRLPACHNVQQKTVKRFFGLRLKIKDD